MFKIFDKSFIFQIVIVEVFYLNSIKQFLHFVEQFDQLEVYLPFSRLLTWNTGVILKYKVFQ